MLGDGKKNPHSLTQNTMQTRSSRGIVHTESSRDDERVAISVSRKAAVVRACVFRNLSNLQPIKHERKEHAE